jgi:23S rRNA (uracil747-C5)-methyltransferase
MNSFCDYFNASICSSCSKIEATYSHQIKTKEEILLQALQGQKLPALLPTIISAQTQFRNKAKMIVTGTTENPIIGLEGLGSLDEGREILNCPIHAPEINHALPLIKNFITLAKLTPYQISSKTGELKGVILFYSQTSESMYLRFVLRSKESVDRIKKHLPSLLTDIAPLKVVTINIQPVPHALLEGKEEIYLTPEHFLTHQLENIFFKIHPEGFIQTNQEVAAKLYTTAGSWIKEIQVKKFSELYCGQGAFSFFAAPFIEKGLGIEINSKAVEVANQTAKLHQFDHLHFKVADASKVMEELKNFNPDMILVNPPRRGLAEAIDILSHLKPSHLIYSSCNFETLAKDLNQLKNYYEIKRIQIFDMFPHTHHFETLVHATIKAY